MAGWDESPTAWRVAHVDGEPGLVDGYVMVKPAQHGEVRWIMIPVVSTMFDVVDLEPVAAVATFDDAAFVTPGDKVAHRRWDR
jgi:hypothetical protein